MPVNPQRPDKYAEGDALVKPLMDAPNVDGVVFTPFGHDPEDDSPRKYKAVLTPYIRLYVTYADLGDSKGWSWYVGWLVRYSYPLFKEEGIPSWERQNSVTTWHPGNTTPDVGEDYLSEPLGKKGFTCPDMPLPKGIDGREAARLALKGYDEIFGRALQ